MSGRQAKAIRRAVYGDRDFRERTYTQTYNGFRIIRIDTTRSIKVPMRTIYADSFRSAYQRMKKS